MTNVGFGYVYGVTGVGYFGADYSSFAELPKIMVPNFRANAASVVYNKATWKEKAEQKNPVSLHKKVAP